MIITSNIIFINNIIIVVVLPNFLEFGSNSKFVLVVIVVFRVGKQNGCR